MPALKLVDREAKRWIIADAIVRGAVRGLNAEAAIESVIDDCRQYAVGSRGAAMLDYYVNRATENTIKSMVKKVQLALDIRTQHALQATPIAKMTNYMDTTTSVALRAR